VILLTRFCKLLTTVAILSGGHVPQVPQWHDASAKKAGLQHTFKYTQDRLTDKEINEIKC